MVECCSGYYYLSWLGSVAEGLGLIPAGWNILVGRHAMNLSRGHFLRGAYCGIGAQGCLETPRCPHRGFLDTRTESPPFLMLALSCVGIKIFENHRHVDLVVGKLAQFLTRWPCILNAFSTTNLSTVA